jgi:hypothetical protein
MLLGSTSVGRLHRMEGIMDQGIYKGILEEPMLRSAEPYVRARKLVFPAR